MTEPRSTPPPSTPPPRSAPAPTSALPPPPPPPPPGPGGTTGFADAFGWLAAICVLLLPMGIAYLRKSGDGETAYAVGYAFGTGALVVVIAVAARAVLARLHPRAEAVATPLLVGIVALVAIGVQFALRAEERASGDVEQLAESCAADDPTPFGAPAPGTELVEPTEAEWNRFKARSAAVATEGFPIDSLAVRWIVGDGRRLGVAAAAPGVGSHPDALAGFQAGVVHSSSTAPTGRQVFVAGEPAQLHAGAGYGIVTGRNGCWGIAIFGPSGEFVNAMSKSLLAG